MRYVLLALIAAVAVAGMFVAAPTEIHAGVYAAGAMLAASDIARLRGSTMLASGTIFMATAEEQIGSLETQRTDLLAASQAIMDGLEEGVDLSDDQADQITANADKVESIDKRIAALKKMLPQGQGRRSAAEPTNRNEPGDGNRRTVPATARTNPGTGGFRNFGAFAQCVKDAEIGDRAAQERLQNAATTYSTEGTGADGGFAVPPDFRREIAERVMGEGSLIDMTDRLVTASNSIMLPKDETTPWQTSGGVQSNWEGEGGTMTESKISLTGNQVRLNKLTTLVKATDELLSDAPLLDSYLRRKAPVKMAAKINTAIIRGTGVGQPLGIMSSGATVTQTAEGTQGADTIWFRNIVKMVSRLYETDQSRVVWLINQDVLPQLMQMAFDPAATSKTPVWLPANGLAGQRFSTLMGKPVIPLQACSTIGDLGDIILADMAQYMTATKGQDIRTDVSIHLHFDQDITTFKFVMRVAGQPWWGSTITPQTSSAALGSFVMLAAR